ncbi:MAG: hypothetical protein WCW17_01585 [Patescibacteria group bacterium]|jgi:hypothetical protein
MSKRKTFNVAVYSIGLLFLLGAISFSSYNLFYKADELPSANLALTTSSAGGQVSNNANFNLYVNFIPSGNTICAISFTINYPTDTIQLAGEPVLGEVYDLAVEADTSVPGIINYALGVKGCSTSSAQLLTVPLKAISLGTANITISSSEAVTDIDGQVVPFSNVPTVINIIPLAKPVVTTSKTFTYKSTLSLAGTKSAELTKIVIGGVTTDVSAIATTWAVSVNLTIGNNNLSVVGKDNLNNLSDAASYSIVRRKMADADNDGFVNINDFGSLMLNWKKTGADNVADFNEDLTVDIKDFGNLMLNWNK